MNTLRPLFQREWLQHRLRLGAAGRLPLALALLVAGFAQYPDRRRRHRAGRRRAARAAGAGVDRRQHARCCSLIALLTSAIFVTGLARRDHADRSIEFWLSLPVGHAAEPGRAAAGAPAAGAGGGAAGRDWPAVCAVGCWSSAARSGSQPGWRCRGPTCWPPPLPLSRALAGRAAAGDAVAAAAGAAGRCCSPPGSGAGAGDPGGRDRPGQPGARTPVRRAHAVAGDRRAVPQRDSIRWPVPAMHRCTSTARTNSARRCRQIPATGLADFANALALLASPVFAGAMFVSAVSLRAADRMATTRRAGRRLAPEHVLRWVYPGLPGSALDLRIDANGRRGRIR